MKRTEVGRLMLPLVGVVTLWLYVLSKNDGWTITDRPWGHVSQIMSLLGTVTMATTFVLSSRWKWLEELFGGQDKVVKQHKKVGIMSFLMLISHPLLLAIESLPEWDQVGAYLWFSGIDSLDMGVAAMLIMTMSVIATVLIKLPYQTWLKTHDLMGISLIIAAGHILNIGSDVGRFWPLRVWVMGWLGLALVAFIYKVIAYRWIAKKYRMVISRVKKLGVITEVWMRPINQRIKFDPGQFGYFLFEQNGLREEHPFSFSSGPEEKEVRISVKGLGDFTSRVPELRAGTKVWIWGPRGRLGKWFSEGKDLVIIGGGIGITPFLSMLRSFDGNRGKMWLFYCTNNKKEAVYDEEIKNLSDKGHRIRYINHCSRGGSRLRATDVKQVVGKVADKYFLICGPKQMIEDVSKQLVAVGVKRDRIDWEDFNFKD